MTITGFTHSTSVDVPVQWFEVFTGAGRRRDWSDEEKDQILAESYSGEMSVSAVARRHGLSPGQLFTWRRQARQHRLGHDGIRHGGGQRLPDDELLGLARRQTASTFFRQAWRAMPRLCECGGEWRRGHRCGENGSGELAHERSPSN